MVLFFLKISQTFCYVIQSKRKVLNGGVVHKCGCHYSAVRESRCLWTVLRFYSRIYEKAILADKLIFEPMFSKPPYLHPPALLLFNSPLFAVTHNTSINHLTSVCRSFFSLQNFSRASMKSSPFNISVHSACNKSDVFFTNCCKTFVCLWQ